MRGYFEKLGQDLILMRKIRQREMKLHFSKVNSPDWLRQCDGSDVLNIFPPVKTVLGKNSQEKARKILTPQRRSLT